ncbi:hypothetical protein B9479_006862 [Cryptococcus floricola]|uniref:Uncharacterized protein n=1 Tax=Cryptococcus floricola TaxID=2591691 RepID=A0A5D3APB7_9TREE|nr:hypothetical protein B9479_006862 [Cryptococcus floricola]
MSNEECGFTSQKFSEIYFDYGDTDAPKYVSASSIPPLSDNRKYLTPYVKLEDGSYVPAIGSNGLNLSFLSSITLDVNEGVRVFKAEMIDHQFSVYIQKWVLYLEKPA